MSWTITALRRSLWMILLAGLGGAVWAWQRDRDALPSPSSPPEWPPLPTPPVTSEPAPEPAPSRAAASFVNALVDAPEARSDAASGTWVAPDDDGSCPVSHPIKANDNSGIYHRPGGRFYDRTQAERCYATADAAEADGYRAAKA